MYKATECSLCLSAIAASAGCKYNFWKTMVIFIYRWVYYEHYIQGCVTGNYKQRFTIDEYVQVAINNHRYAARYEHKYKCSVVDMYDSGWNSATKCNVQI